MDEAMKFAVGIAAAIAGLIGLFLASRGDAGIQIFGLLLAGFAVFLNFWLIKRHFDRIDKTGVAPGEARESRSAP